MLKLKRSCGKYAEAQMTWYHRDCDMTLRWGFHGINYEVYCIQYKHKSGAS